MNWNDEGIVLAVRAHGETAAVVELLTRHHGRHAGLVHGGRSRRLRPILQIGNHVEATWRGRLADHLGHFTVEPVRGYAAAALDDAMALAGLGAMAALARLLPERDPHPSLYEITLFVLGFLTDPSVWPALYVRWELALLDELGLGLDLGSCAATGSRDDLIYVSPRSGRAVSAAAGEPYKDRLLALPPFLVARRRGELARGDILAGLELTGHFITMRALMPAGLTMPEGRVRLRELVARMEAGPEAI
jgi:DNA repair protein RecO (recombination protein O)